MGEGRGYVLTELDTTCYGLQQDTKRETQMTHSYAYMWDKLIKLQIIAIIHRAASSIPMQMH